MTQATLSKTMLGSHTVSLSYNYNYKDGFENLKPIAEVDEPQCLKRESPCLKKICLQ